MEKMLGNPPVPGVGLVPLFPLFPLFPLSRCPAVAGVGVGATGGRARLRQATLEHQAFLRPEQVAAVLGQLLVDLVVQGGAQGRVGGEVGHDERDDGDCSDREQKSEPQ